MSEFNFKVGDRVRASRWNPYKYVTVAHIGIQGFMGDDGKYYDFASGCACWLPYVAPPVRRKWLIETEERPYRRGVQFVAGNTVFTASGWDDHDRIIAQIVGDVVEVTE